MESYISQVNSPNEFSMKTFLRALAVVVLVLAAIIVLSLGIHLLDLSGSISRTGPSGDVNGTLALVAGLGILYLVATEVL